MDWPISGIFCSVVIQYLTDLMCFHSIFLTMTGKRAKVMREQAELFRVLRSVLSISPHLHYRMKCRTHQHGVILGSQHSKGAQRYGRVMTGETLGRIRELRYHGHDTGTSIGHKTKVKGPMRNFPAFILFGGGQPGHLGEVPLELA